MPGRVVYASNSNASRNKGSSRRTAEAGRLYSKTESVRISDASRDALQRTSRRPRPRSSPGYYSLPERPDPALIPPYEDFLNEARARVSYHDVELVDSESKPIFRPDPYLDGYPSGYYNTELRSQRTGQSSTLVGTGSTASSTLVDSSRASFDRPVPARYPRRQARVQWGPVHQCVEPPVVSTNLEAQYSNTSGRNHPLAHQRKSEAHEVSTTQAQSTGFPFSNSDLETYRLKFSCPPAPAFTRKVNISPSNHIHHQTYHVPPSSSSSSSSATTVMATAITTTRERSDHPAQLHGQCHVRLASKSTNTHTPISTRIRGPRVDRSRRSQRARAYGSAALLDRTPSLPTTTSISKPSRCDATFIEAIEAAEVAQVVQSKFSPDSSPDHHFGATLSKTWNRVKSGHED